MEVFPERNGLNCIHILVFVWCLYLKHEFSFEPSSLNSSTDATLSSSVRSAVFSMHTACSPVYLLCMSSSKQLIYYALIHLRWAVWSAENAAQIIRNTLLKQSMRFQTIPLSYAIFTSRPLNRVYTYISLSQTEMR